MKRVLVAPLDWGLGHATRCIPIIRLLLARQCTVLLAGSGSALALLQEEFPELPSFILPAYNPTYPRKGSMVWKMARQLPHFITTIRREHNVLEALVREQAIDLVIADNRYGCWSEAVPCIFITHQSNILMPQRFGWLSPLVRRVNIRSMRRFSRCWIPDVPGNHSLAGRLISFGNAPQALDVAYIGAISRFVPPEHPVPVLYDIVAICSGPEPQRSELEALLLRQLIASAFRFVLIRGVVTTVRAHQPVASGRGEVIDFLPAKDLQRYIAQGGIIVARSGYSTVMDMAALGSKVIFVPTPGQTEQEYLAVRLKEQGIAFFMHQHNFALVAAYSASKHYTGFKAGATDNSLLVKAIDKALQL